MIYQIYVLFICLVIPLILLLFLLDKKSRLTIGFVIIGITICLFTSEINTLLLKLYSDDVYYVTTTITPITEELFKAIPIIYFAFVFSPSREKLITVSMSLGIGFALLETSYILVMNKETVDYLWAIARGFGAGLMHGLCTASIGYAMSFIKERKKLYFTGTFGILAIAIIYHAVYNTLVQSQHKYIGFLLPLVSYVPIVIAVRKQLQRHKHEKIERVRASDFTSPFMEDYDK